MTAICQQCEATLFPAALLHLLGVCITVLESSNNLYCTEEGGAIQ